jgi:hypothetical protein
MTANGQRYGKGTPGGLWNQVLSDYDMARKGVQTTNRILGCEDQCNQLAFSFANLRTTSGYRFDNVANNPWRALFQKHVTILATPTVRNGAPVIHLDPLNNRITEDW